MVRSLDVIVVPGWCHAFERDARRKGFQVRLLSKRDARGYRYEVRGERVAPQRIRGLKGVCALAERGTGRR